MNNILTTRKPSNMAEETAEERVNKEFESIIKQKNDSRREKINQRIFCKRAIYCRAKVSRRAV